MDVENVTIPCPCKGTPHPDGDTVGLLPKLGLRGGVSVQTAIYAALQGGPIAATEMTGILAEAYVLNGVATWSLVDPLGQPLEVNRENIVAYLLSDFNVSAAVADKCDELYMQPVVSPLALVASTSSPNGSTSAPTSVPNGHTPKRPKRSKRSSTSTTTTGVTATTTG